MLTLARRTTRLPVELVEWTEQPGLRRALANAGVPRVLLVDPGTAPPSALGVDEGWVRSDATDAEIDACARAVLARLVANDRIELVGDRVWSYLGRTVRLTQLQSRLFAELAASRGVTVSHQRLMVVGWQGKSVNHMSLDSAMQRLRDQLIGTGLCVRSRRGIGFVLP